MPAGSARACGARLKRPGFVEPPSAPHRAALPFFRAARLGPPLAWVSLAWVPPAKAGPAHGADSQRHHHAARRAQLADPVLVKEVHVAAVGEVLPLV
jgi:hypothetical protein